MFTEEREKREQTLNRMQNVRLDYMQVVSKQIDEQTGAIEDQGDTIYSENYTAGIAAVMFANGYRFSGHPAFLNNALRLIRRSTVRLESVDTVGRREP